jgi:tetratricopeptide (TPR) repeat protein
MDRFDWLEVEQVEVADQARTRRVRPTDSASYLRAGEDMFRSGHFKAAADYYRKAIGLDSRMYDAWIYLIDTLVRAGRLDEAEATSSEAIDAYRQVRVFCASRALVLTHRGEAEEAWHLSEVSMDGSDSSWYARCVRGEILARMSYDMRFEAADLFEEAARRTEHAWRANLLGGWCFLEADLPALATGFLAEAAHWNPRAPLCWLCLGDSFRELRLYDQAQFYYQCAAQLEPRNDLVLQRRKRVVPMMYGLLRLFRKEDLRKRWKSEFEKLLEQQEPETNDYL